MPAWGCWGFRCGYKTPMLFGERPEEAVPSCLVDLGIPEVRPAYFALHLSASSGWAGYIPFEEEQHHPWRCGTRSTRVKYLAVRLFAEREFVEYHCRRVNRLTVRCHLRHP